MTRMQISSAVVAAAALLAGSIPATAFLSPKSPSFLAQSPASRVTNVSTTRPICRSSITCPTTCLFSSTANNEELTREIKSMRVAAIKSELESYGINTKTFLEKSELVDALIQARNEGKTPIFSSSSTSTSTASSTSSATSSPSSTTTYASSSSSRDEQIAQELTQTSTLRIAQLKSELEESFGMNTKQFLEKSELAKALAEARVDERLGGNTGSKKKKKRRSSDEDEEVEEVKASKVEVITSDDVGPRKKKAGREDSSQFGGGNPFTGGAGVGGSPFGVGGGMGGMDMGSIADMMKNMGGMGGAAAGNPFGGAAAGAGGANPFANMGMGGMPNMGGPGGMADAMKAAQAAMSNPKTAAVIAKAQQNPKVMAAVQECMGNPMAFSKYMSDPEVGPILKELQESMM